MHMYRYPFPFGYTLSFPFGLGLDSVVFWFAQTNRSAIRVGLEFKLSRQTQYNPPPISPPISDNYGHIRTITDNGGHDL